MKYGQIVENIVMHGLLLQLAATCVKSVIDMFQELSGISYSFGVVGEYHCIVNWRLNMENIVDVPRAHNILGMHGSSSSCERGRRCTHSQGSKLRFLLLLTQITMAMSERNTQIVSATSGPWNKTLQKDILHCSSFHPANISDYFYYWPEDRFDHCCQWLIRTENLTDYGYTTYGTNLLIATYYDLGPLDTCFPYWSCKHLIEKYEDVVTFQIDCEKNDVMNLNTYRFWVLVVVKYGLVETALPLVVFLQLMVCVAIGARHGYCRFRRTRGTRGSLDKEGTPLPTLQSCSKICKEYWKDGAIWKNLSMDWMHLLLLSITGNGLLEAVGRQEPDSWQSKLFYRFSKLYIAMSVVLWFASLSHQFAMWIAVEKRLTHNFVPLTLIQEEKTKEQVASGTPASTAPAKKNYKDSAKKKYKDPLKKLKKILDLNLDWQWQPIITQAAILFCLWAFLTFVNGDETSGTILGFLVQAASPWSLLYSFRVGFKTMPFLIKGAARVNKLRLVFCKCCCGRSQSEIEKPEAVGECPLFHGHSAFDMRSDHQRYSQQLPV